MNLNGKKRKKFHSHPPRTHKQTVVAPTHTCPRRYRYKLFSPALERSARVGGNILRELWATVDAILRIESSADRAVGSPLLARVKHDKIVLALGDVVYFCAHFKNFFVIFFFCFCFCFCGAAGAGGRWKCGIAGDRVMVEGDCRRPKGMEGFPE